MKQHYNVMRKDRLSLMLLLFGLLIAGLSFYAGLKYEDSHKLFRSVPGSAQHMYDQLYDSPYKDSMGVSLSHCKVKHTGKSIYEVSGSGGFSGVSYYYDLDGELIGEHRWSDVIHPDDPAPEPPFANSELNCTLLKHSN